MRSLVILNSLKPDTLLASVSKGPYFIISVFEEIKTQVFDNFGHSYTAEMVKMG